MGYTYTKTTHVPIAVAVVVCLSSILWQGMGLSYKNSVHVIIYVSP